MPLPSNTSSIKFSSCLSPILHGTHLPHVWHWHILKKAAAKSTGHDLLGLTAILLCKSPYNSSIVYWALSIGVLINLFMFFPPYQLNILKYTIVIKFFSNSTIYNK